MSTAPVGGTFVGGGKLESSVAEGAKQAEASGGAEQVDDGQKNSWTGDCDEDDETEMT